MHSKYLILPSANDILDLGVANQVHMDGLERVLQGKLEGGLVLIAGGVFRQLDDLGLVNLDQN